MECLKHFSMTLPIQVHLVQHDGHRNVIHLAGHKDTVQERELDFRIIDCSDYECPVQICRYDMGLARQVRRLSDDIVPAWPDGCNDGRILDAHTFTDGIIFRNVGFERNDIAYGHRIGSRRPLQADLSPQHCRKQIPFRQAGKQIMASRMLYYCRFSFYHCFNECSDIAVQRYNKETKLYSKRDLEAPLYCKEGSLETAAKILHHLLHVVSPLLVLVFCQDFLKLVILLFEECSHLLLIRHSTSHHIHHLLCLVLEDLKNLRVLCFSELDYIFHLVSLHLSHLLRAWHLSEILCLEVASAEEKHCAGDCNRKNQLFHDINN